MVLGLNQAVFFGPAGLKRLPDLILGPFFVLPEMVYPACFSPFFGHALIISRVRLISKVGPKQAK